MRSTWSSSRLRTTIVPIAVVISAVEARNLRVAPALSGTQRPAALFSSSSSAMASAEWSGFIGGPGVMKVSGSRRAL